KVNQGLGSFVEKALNFFTTFDIGPVVDRFEPFITLFGNIKDSIVEAWPTVTAIFEDVRTVLGFAADEINDKWPLVNEVFQTVLGLVQNISNWVVNNWPTV